MESTEPLNMRRRACPVCGSEDDSEVFVPETYDQSALDGYAFASRKIPEFMHFRMLRCPSCATLYASPAPAPAWLAAAYDAAQYDSAEEASLAADTYARQLAGILPRLPDKNGALDIGTGDGAFLERLLSLGFSNIVGVEPSRAPVGVANPEVKNLIRLGAFRAEDYAPGSFSLVSCFQTLEHVDDPLRLCRDAHDLLKPGGAFVTAVHNSRSWSARLLRTRSPIFDIEHLQLLCRPSIHRLLHNAGFGGIRVFAYANTYPLKYWFRLAPLPAALKHWLSGAIQATGAGELRLPMMAGNLFAVGWKGRPTTYA